MKCYHFDNDVKDEDFDAALRDIDNGISVKIYARPNMTFRTANKVAALGKEVFIAGTQFTDEKETTVHSLLKNSPEDVIIEIDVNLETLASVYQTLERVENSMPMFGAKVRLIENLNLHAKQLLGNQRWNELIVKCYDHGINLCWSGEAAGYHYSAYLEDIANV